MICQGMPLASCFPVSRPFRSQPKITCGVMPMAAAAPCTEYVPSGHRGGFAALPLILLISHLPWRTLYRRSGSSRRRSSTASNLRLALAHEVLDRRADRSQVFSGMEEVSMNFWLAGGFCEQEPWRALQNSVSSKGDNSLPQGGQKQDDANTKKHYVLV
jgi:hypothetical protein